MLRALFIFACVSLPLMFSGGAVASGKLECLSPKEARDVSGANHLLDSLQVMKNMSSLSRAEPVSIKLCKSDNSYIYEVMLLHREGKLLRVLVDAVSGKTVNP